jgi:hypothetical protein
MNRLAALGRVARRVVLTPVFYVLVRMLAGGEKLVDKHGRAAEVKGAIRAPT